MDLLKFLFLVLWAVQLLGCAQTQGSLDATSDPVVASDRADAADDQPLMDVILASDGDVLLNLDGSRDAGFDLPQEDGTPDGVSSQDVRDAESDLPIVIVPSTMGTQCHDLRLHSVAEVVLHTTPPPWPLRREPIPSGFYILTAADYYPEPKEDGGLPSGFRQIAYTLRARSGSPNIDIAFAAGFDRLSSLVRYSCNFNPRSAEPYYFCPLTCIPPGKGFVGNPGFTDFEAAGDQLRIQFGNYLLTLRRVGPP